MDPKPVQGSFRHLETLYQVNAEAPRVTLWQVITCLRSPVYRCRATLRLKLYHEEAGNRKAYIGDYLNQV